ncbi:hypothetical protein BSKO_02164 [Bryopsis sp. KO-2023]|nr:hypothetical protein BSKO_02164 [Bryopsis sp. KO-2023]
MFSSGHFEERAETISAQSAGGGDDLLAGTMEVRYQNVLSRTSALLAEKHPARRADLWSIMPKFVEAVELTDVLSRLSVVHVAGTKGKGSTCAMTESILRSSGYSTGLFTSPHLCDVRERIRVDGKMVEKAVFVEAAEWCLDRCGLVAGGLPFFRFMTLVAFKVFEIVGVEAVVLEVGLGGRLDATNIIPKPVVCGVTPLGYDHMDVLGSTLREIAAEKAGIFKVGARALTVPQLPEAMESLTSRSQEIDNELVVVDPLESYLNHKDVKDFHNLGGFQQNNASLAIALAREWETRSLVAGENASRKHRLDSLAAGRIPGDYVNGLRDFDWPGRAQIVQDSGRVHRNLTFCLDGAHTIESMEACGSWFATHAHRSGVSKNILLFYCMKARDPHDLLFSLGKALRTHQVDVHSAIFAPINSSKTSLLWSQNGSKSVEDLMEQRIQRDAWAKVQTTLKCEQLSDMSVTDRGPSTLSNTESVLPSLDAALLAVRNFADVNAKHDVRVLVTGSLYLVGDFLKLLGRAPK